MDILHVFSFVSYVTILICIVELLSVFLSGMRAFFQYVFFLCYEIIFSDDCEDADVDVDNKTPPACTLLGVGQVILEPFSCLPFYVH